MGPRCLVRIRTAGQALSPLRDDGKPTGSGPMTRAKVTSWRDSCLPSAWLIPGLATYHRRWCLDQSRRGTSPAWAHSPASPHVHSNSHVCGSTCGVRVNLEELGWAGLEAEAAGTSPGLRGDERAPGPPSSPAASPPPLPPPPRSSRSPISLVHWPVGAPYTTIAAIVIVLQRRLPRHSLDHHSELDQVPASQGCYSRGGRDHKILQGQ